jgi:hypothetical protein
MLCRDKPLPPHAAMPYHGCILITLWGVSWLVIVRLLVGWLVSLQKEYNEVNDALI